VMRDVCNFRADLYAGATKYAHANFNRQQARMHVACTRGRLHSVFAYIVTSTILAFRTTSETIDNGLIIGEQYSGRRTNLSMADTSAR